MLKTISLGQLLEVIASIGVIAGILLLAYELRQNNILLTSQANLELSSNRVHANELMATDERLAELLTTVDGEELSDVDRFRRERFYVLLFTRWEWEHRQYIEGLIDDAYLPVSDWVAIVDTFPGMKDVWAVDRNRGRSPAFVEFMDANVAEKDL